MFCVVSVCRVEGSKLTRQGQLALVPGLVGGRDTVAKEPGSGGASNAIL